MKPTATTAKDFGRVLIATCDTDLLALLGEFFRREGAEVMLVRAAKDAIARAMSGPPDLIILERELPGLKAEEVLKNLQSFESTRQVPAIIITDKSSEADGRPTARVGIDQVLEKPLPLTALRSALKRIARAKARQEQEREAVRTQR